VEEEEAAALRNTLDVELNSATDNPMVFVGEFDESQGRGKMAADAGKTTSKVRAKRKRKRKRKREKKRERERERGGTPST
jgi:hypothetical protein